MFNPSRPIDRLALVSVAALLLGATLAPHASGWQQPATPCPCAADGVCRPNGPWGHTPTKWRPWPGDTLGRVAPSADEEETREQLQLSPFELPPITKEGQRGPNITKPPKAPRDEASPAPAMDDMDDLDARPPARQPEADALQGFDPDALGEPGDFQFEPPVEDPLHPEAEPQPEFDLKQEAEPEADPLDDFDPFSQLDRRRSFPAPAVRRTSHAPAATDDAPPQLPPSLRNFSRRSPPARRATPHASRFRRPAMALVQ